MLVCQDSDRVNDIVNPVQPAGLWRFSMGWEWQELRGKLASILSSLSRKFWLLVHTKRPNSPGMSVELPD